MAELQVHLLRALDGKPTFDEFSVMSLQWKEPGMIYRWCDRHQQVLPVRLRQGWKVCNIEDDFRKRGCPEDRLPTAAPGGEIIFGDSILCKMPLSLYNTRYRRDVLEPINQRKLAGRQEALSAGEAAARELRAKGVRVGANVLSSTSERDIEREWNDPRLVTSKDGAHVIDPNFERK